ncbi:MAG: glycosyltransferase [Bacteroidales bacterium]|nr:glycosyltransferase [Bacteroidales bacterium]
MKIDISTLSIITVVLNDAEAFENTFHNVRNQKFEGIQYIIIDGNSSDGTIELIKKYEEHIDYWSSEPDNGIYDAMNKGIARANGEWIMFLNAGDTFYNDHILTDIFSEDLSDVDVIYGDSIADYGSFSICQKAGNLKDLWRGMRFNHQSVIVKTELLKRRPFNLKFSIGADFDFIYHQYLQKKKFKYFPLPISVFDVNGISNKRPVKSFCQHVQIVRTHHSTSFTRTLFYGLKWIWLSAMTVVRIVLPVRLYLRIVRVVTRGSFVDRR